MNRDEIIRMAREAGFCVHPRKQTIEPASCVCGCDATAQIERFAALVAAAERADMKLDGIHTCHDKCERPVCVAIREAVAAEREACAKVCEEQRDDWLRGLGRYEFMAEGADFCADAIRARREK